MSEKQILPLKSLHNNKWKDIRWCPVKKVKTNECYEIQEGDLTNKWNHEVVLGERAQFFKAQFEIWWKRENPTERDEKLK